MVDHPIQGLMRTTMENLKGMIDVNTVVGDPVECGDGSVIIPVSRVSLGFASGGGEYGGGNGRDGGEAGEGLPFGGGSGGGMSVSPVGFLVVAEGRPPRWMPVRPDGAPLERLLEAVPRFVMELRSALAGEGEPGAPPLTEPR